YQTPGAAGYYAYFGAAAGDPAEGWYAYDLGGWHVVVLNSNLDMAAGSAQETWLRADLASHPATCTLAYLHHPRFSSGSTHGDKRGTEPLWRALYEAGAELVLAGHEHSYERFAPQDPTGVADPAFGLRSFVVGVGGAGFYPLGPPAANSEARQNDTFGVLALTLRPDGYDWRFVSEAGKTFTDTGTGSCHAAPPTPTRTDGAVSSTAIATAAPIGSAPSDAPVMAGAPAFGPVADARVEEANPTTNYGSGTTLRADAGAGVAIESYLRFAVSETAGPVRRATLRLWATDATADGPAVHGCGDTAWAEKATTWASRPGRAGAATADAEAIAAGGWVAYDVTSLVSGNGAVCLALVPQSTDGVTFSSRQATTATNRPQLVVEVAAPSPTGVPGGPATTATPTTTPLSEDTAAPTSTDTQVSSTPTAASTVPTDTPTDTPVPPTLTPTSTSTPTDTAVPTTPS
ncbi:MAG: acid phosphatase type 7, partial [Thermomicrobiales bacterium]|nr:acid phosphatase type 7 [Thermomicrobiales bacterium]